jgi:hypothetical protein
MPPGWHARASSVVGGVVLMMQYFIDDDIQIYFDPCINTTFPLQLTSV